MYEVNGIDDLRQLLSSCPAEHFLAAFDADGRSWEVTIEDMTQRVQAQHQASRAEAISDGEDPDEYTLEFAEHTVVDDIGYSFFPEDAKSCLTPDGL